MERTSKKAASAAARTLKSRKASKDAKSAAASALTQREDYPISVTLYRLLSGREGVSVVHPTGTFSSNGPAVILCDERPKKKARA